MSDSPSPPVQIDSVHEESANQQKTSTNWGVIILIVSIVAVIGTVIYFTVFDKKNKFGQSSYNNTAKIPILDTRTGMPLNSRSISSNTGYGGKFNY